MKGELLSTYLLFTISADRFLARQTSGSYHFLELVNKSMNEFGGDRKDRLYLPGDRKTLSPTFEEYKYYHASLTKGVLILVPSL